MSDFKSIGDKKYQEKVVFALLQDHMYAEQMGDILKADFFDQEALSLIVRSLYDYRKKYDAWPSADVLSMVALENVDDDNQTLKLQVKDTLVGSKHPLNGDMRYIQDTSLDFCKRQSIMEAMNRALDQVEKGTYDEIQKIITTALSKGSSNDMGHDYMKGFQERVASNVRNSVETPWAIMNRELNGGWERGTISTFIAPTGAGKTHFLCNVSAGGIEKGYNVCYISLEIAQYKIGLRHDAYFSGVKINNIGDDQDRVKDEIDKAVKGRLFIKEFPTKSASVQTIRAYLKRLETLENFRPDILVVDYADLLRPSRSYGEKRHELESNYEELRGLGQEYDCVVVTADQTNRAGLDQEVVTLSSIAEAYAKATVCDLIMTVSRRREDKVANTGKLFIAKSRLGPDGKVFPFLMDGSTVKVKVLDEITDSDLEQMLGSTAPISNQLKERFEKLGLSGMIDS